METDRKRGQFRIRYGAESGPAIVQASSEPILDIPTSPN
jgi:hypothetical protein